MLFLVNNIIVLIKHNKVIQISIICVLLLSVGISLFSSFLAGIIIVANYFIGMFICSLFLQYQTVTFSLICDITKEWRKSKKTSKDIDGACNVCFGNRCRRYLKQDRTPWKSIRVKKKLNDAVEHLFNTILNEFIQDWYGEFTSDVTFVSSLKNSIRFSFCLAVNKLAHLDTGKIISNKLIPCAIRHIDDCLCMDRIARLKNIGIEQVAEDYLGSRLHIAATNRNREINYLRQLASFILPTLMPQEYMRCENFSVFMRELMSMWTLLPLMDVLADPNVINHLVILTITVLRLKKSAVINTSFKEQDTTVEILCNFGEKNASTSPFAMELKSILKDTELLYEFMQYLKKEDKVHLLQFCLDLEEFNNALLLPDLTQQQLITIHSTAMSLYQRYLDPTTDQSSHIGCDRQISRQLRQLLAGGVERIVRLRTTEPLLFAAADHVYQVLERDWLKAFCRSAGFYKYLCKTKGVKKDKTSNQQQNQFGSNTNQFHGERSTVSRISSGLGKIKGALSVKAPIEGAPFCNAQEIHVLESQQFIEMMPQTYDMMNTWTISIPKITIQEKERNKSSQQPERFKYGNSKWLFHIEIKSTVLQPKNILVDSKIAKRDLIDNKGMHSTWTVFRKERDFHILKTKLEEVLNITENIAFASMTTTKIAVEERKNKYEIFLRFLQSHQSKLSILHRQLLHNFLTSSTAFSQDQSSSEKGKQSLETVIPAANAVVDLESIYQSVALRLRKEKGQHLDVSFMSGFLKSTGQHPHIAQNRNKLKQQPIDWAQLSDAMDVVNAAPITINTATINCAISTSAGSQRHIPKTLHSHVFNDNFGLHSQWSLDKIQIGNSANSVHPKGFTDSLFYLLKHIMKVRVFYLRVLAALCSVAQGVLESLAHRYIDYKIKSALNQENLTYLVTQLQDVIFSKQTLVTAEQLEERKRDAFKHLNNVIPDRLAKLLSNDGTEVKVGATKLLEILQNPHLNKHLIYNWLDLILLELHPELNKAAAESEKR